MDDDSLDKQRALQALTKIFERVERFQQVMAASADYAAVTPGSGMSGDDKKSSPYHVSHYACHLITTANEHLHILKTLMVDAAVLPRSPVFTVVRGAIEPAAAAYWMLLPNQRPERVRRRLSLYDDETGLRASAFEDFGAKGGPNIAEIRRRYGAIAVSACGADVILRVPSHTNLIREVDKGLIEDFDKGITDTRIEPSILATWRLCSGFAHGYQWPAMAIFGRETLKRSLDGTLDARSTNQEIAVFMAVNAAESVMMAAMQRFSLLANSLLYENYRAPIV